MQSGPGPRPFDTATRRLIDGDPEGWLAWIGLPADGPVTPIDSDVGTVLAEVDKVLRVEGPEPWIAHLELQSGYDPELPMRMLQYNALLLNRHKVTVESTVILLRPRADGPEMNGYFERRSRRGSRTVAFDYEVVRLWQQPVEELLSGSLSVVPLSPIAAVERRQLPDVVRRVDERIRREATPGETETLRTATLFLLGLRYDDRTVREVIPNMSWLQDSSIYQAAVAEGEARGETRGRAVEVRRLIVSLGTKTLGAPSPSIVRRLDALDDLAQLELLHDRILTAESWADLLASETDRQRT